jgi:hypothetical protein
MPAVPPRLTSTLRSLEACVTDARSLVSAVTGLTRPVLLGPRGLFFRRLTGDCRVSAGDTQST